MVLMSHAPRSPRRPRCRRTSLGPGPERYRVTSPSPRFQSSEFRRRRELTGDELGLVLLDLGLHVVEVPPTVVKKYATGKGGGPDSSKDQVLAAVIRRYPAVDVTGNDEADALVLAAMGARWAGHPIDDPLPVLQTTAMAKVAWPDHEEVPF